MILRKDSVLNQLPNGIDKRQLLLLDSLRFTLEIIDYSYNQLYEQLLMTSKVEKKTSKLSEIFIYAWNIIDYTKRFNSLYRKMPSENNYQNIEGLNAIRYFRNTLQHLDQRVDESILKNEKPIYGALKWEFKDIDKGTVLTCVAISGINYYTKNHPFYFNELEESKQEINNIILETVDIKEMKEINISELIKELKETTVNLEKRLKQIMIENNLGMVDWTKMKDISLFLKNK